MFYLDLKKTLLIFGVITTPFLAIANEEAAAPAKEEKKIPVMRSSEETYAVVAARVAGLEAKVKGGEAEIQRLVGEKQKAKTPEQVQEIIGLMLTQHKDLEKNLKEYDQQRALLKYRYPEKGQQDVREYERIDLKSIEQIEHQMSLGTSVQKTLNKVRMQYEPPEEISKNKASSNVEAQKKSTPQEPGLIDPVILKK